MAFIRYKTKAIFLEKKDRGEADRMFTVFSKEFGKLDILGKGIRQIKSKLRSGADNFYFSDIEFIQGKAYKTLTEAILLDKFSNIGKELPRLEAAAKIAQAATILVPKEEKDENVWLLLFNGFKQINDLEHSKVFLNLLCQYFLWNMFFLLGHSPELCHCAVCGRKLFPETFFFVPEEGGIVCWRCIKTIEEKIKQRGANQSGKGAEGTQKKKKECIRQIKVGTVKIIKFFLKNEISLLKRLKIEKEDKDNLEEITDFYLNFLKREYGGLLAIKNK